jgi:hypothetical protein
VTDDVADGELLKAFELSRQKYKTRKQQVRQAVTWRSIEQHTLMWAWLLLGLVRRKYKAHSSRCGKCSMCSTDHAVWAVQVTSAVRMCCEIGTGAGCCWFC